MFVFAYPGLLFLLLLLPAVVILYILARNTRKKRLKKFGNLKLIKGLMPNHSKYEPGLRLSLILISLAAIIFSFARPWGGVKNQETSRQGIEIVIAVDASNSMLASATEDEGGVDRMRTSKLFLEKLINRLSNDRVGLIAYAGDAYTLIPVTNDYVSAKTFLNSIDPSQIPYQGTNIGAAVELAANSFSKEGDTGKAIILLTDADELEDPNGALSAVKEATKMGIQTDVIGIGSAPVTIPSSSQGRMKDPETGEIVRTALNEELAIEIAKEGDGIYVNASNTDALEELMKQVGKLKKSALESSFLVTHDELYVIFVIIALVALILEFIVTDKKNTIIEKMSLFRKNKTAVVGMLILITAAVSCGKKETTPEPEQGMMPVQSKNDSILSRYSLPKEKDLILEGLDAFNAQRFQVADSAFQDAMKVNPASVVAPLNAGLSITYDGLKMLEARKGPVENDSVIIPYLQQATQLWQQAAAPLVEKGNVSSKAYYNMGNAAFIQMDYGQAIDAYKNALRLNPSDDKARRNLRIAQLKKQNEDKQNQNKQNQQDQQDKKDQDQQDQQNQQQNQQNQQQPKPQNINEQTSQQILEAAERKENQRRLQMRLKNEENPPARPIRNW